LLFQEKSGKPWLRPVRHGGGGGGGGGVHNVQSKQAMTSKRPIIL
jgi:hypothetical protein